MTPQINVKITGLLELEQALKRAPKAMTQAVADAATLAGDHILNTEGVRRYPPAGPGNRPPYPFYKRGVGTQVSKTRNLNNSEKLGSSMVSKGSGGQHPNKSWYVNQKVQSLGSMVVTIGTKVTYAPYVVGDQQSRVMARIGWKQLAVVAKSKVKDIAKILETVLGGALKKAGFATRK